MSFAQSHYLIGLHLIPQPSDVALNPPEIYFYVQDFLIITCGIFYALCYMFYMTRTYRDKTLAGTILFASTCISWEIYYAYSTTTTLFEKIAFSVWFVTDIAFCTVAIRHAYPPHKRSTTAWRLVYSTIACLAAYFLICYYFPDERDQVTGYWTGGILQLLISVGSVYLLVATQSVKGHSLEIWITRYLGCWTAFGVFMWRYVNVPQNWEYVGGFWSVVMIAVTLGAETVYPFVYVWVYRKEREREKGAEVEKKAL